MNKLSKNFVLNEFTKSMAATRHGISNIPGIMVINKLRKLCINILQPVRDHYGKPVRINSGYRSPKLNKIIGGSRRSQHCKGEAADFEVDGISNYELAKWIEDNLDFDQLILEFYQPGIPDSGWVHVSYRGKSVNRGQVLRAEKVGKKTKYIGGLGVDLS